VGSKTGSKTKTKQAIGETGRQCGNHEGPGNKRHGGTTGPTGLGGTLTTGEAATDLTGLEAAAELTGPGQTRGAGELTEQPNAAAGETAKELTGLPCETETTGRLGGTGPDQTRGAAVLTGQLDVTAGEKTAERLDSAGRKQGEDKSAKSRRGRDKNGRRGKRSGS